jgi:DNA polymerase III subunit gamma/tau
VQLTHDAGGADLHSLMTRLERLEHTVAAGTTTAAAPKPVPTDPSTGRATIGGRARRDAPPVAPATAVAEPPSGEPAAPDASPAEPAAAATVDDTALPALFETEVRPKLRGMAKAIFMGAHVGAMVDGALTIGFAGEPHRVRAEEYRAEVEKAFAAAAGRHVTLSLVVDTQSHDEPVAPVKPVVAAPPADEDVDTDDLVDAPPDTVISPIDRLAQAFPGSEIIEERN